MADSQQLKANRRDVMKAAGGTAAATFLGGAFAGTGLASHDEDEYKGVRVNQVGYPMDGQKRAIVTSHGMDVSSVSEFEVVDAETGETVDTGTLNDETLGGGGDSTQPWDSGAIQDEWGTSQEVKIANFTDMIDEPGEYQVVVGDEESFPFTVDEASEVYKEVLRDVGRLYTLKRSNAEVDDSEYTGYSYGPGHEQDEEAIVAEPADGYEDFLAEEDVSPGETIDVSGGWYDAGDYGKYTIPQAVTVAQLMLAYERNPDAFHEGQFHVDDVVDDEDWGTMPDVLVECKYALEWLQKMQRSSGALFFKVAGNEDFPADDVAPGEDDMDRYVFGHSSAATADACGAFAMAARVFEDHDSGFADEMLSCAEDAFSWLEDNEDLVWEQSANQDAGSGRYGRGVRPNGEMDNAAFDEPDRYWAAAELYRTTGEQQYDDYITQTDLGYEGFDGTVEDLPAQVEAPVDWNNPVALGHYAYYWGGGSQAGSNPGDPDEQSAATGINGAFWVADRYRGAGDATDIYASGTYDFFWGHLKSGISRGVQGIWAREVHLDNNNSWIENQPANDLVEEPLHHALGRAATNYSRVTGHGEKSTEHPHDRIVESQNVGHPLPGLMVGGGQLSDLGEEGDCTDEHVQDLIGTGDHLEAYVDEHCSFATNEWAINYTAPLFMMLAEVVGEISETPAPDYASDISAPSAPSNLTATVADDGAVDVSWDAAENANSYTVSVNGTEVTSTSDTSVTLTDDSNYGEGENTVTVEAVNAAGSADASTSFTIEGSSEGCESLPDDQVAEVEGKTVCDVNGDGYFRDIDADGEVSHNDVIEFFEHQHREAWKQPEMFDYSGNGHVRHGDIVELFDYTLQ